MTQYFEKKYSSIWGKNTLKKLLNMKREISSKQYIRVNTSKTSYGNVEQFLKKNRVKFEKTSLPNAIEIKKSFFNLTSSPTSLLGEIYSQDLASQLPILTLPEKIFEKQHISVLDMCASPGSKTTQIADILETKNCSYDITALEPEKKRITKLINNLQKQQVKNCKVFQIKGEDFSSSEKFDLIILDAPCSGNLIGDNNWLKKRNQQGIEQNASLQKKLLKKAYSLLKNDGILVYSTCSMEVEENEMNIDWFVKQFQVKTIQPKFKPTFPTTPLKEYKGKKFSPQVSKTMRLMPLTSKTQGFYVGIIIKTTFK